MRLIILAAVGALAFPALAPAQQRPTEEQLADPEFRVLMQEQRALQAEIQLYVLKHPPHPPAASVPPTQPTPTPIPGH